MIDRAEAPARSVTAPGTRTALLGLIAFGLAMFFAGFSEAVVGTIVGTVLWVVPAAIVLWCLRSLRLALAGVASYLAATALIFTSIARSESSTAPVGFLTLAFPVLLASVVLVGIERLAARARVTDRRGSEEEAR